MTDWSTPGEPNAAVSSSGGCSIQLQRCRARPRGAETEKFVEHEIFERDQWMCGICGQPIDRTLQHDPLSSDPARPEPGNCRRVQRAVRAGRRSPRGWPVDPDKQADAEEGQHHQDEVDPRQHPVHTWPLYGHWHFGPIRPGQVARCAALGGKCLGIKVQIPEARPQGCRSTSGRTLLEPSPGIEIEACRGARVTPRLTK